MRWRTPRRACTSMQRGYQFRAKPDGCLCDSARGYTRAAAVGALTRAHCVSPTAPGRRFRVPPSCRGFGRQPRGHPPGSASREVNPMTITRTALAGALAINVPSIYWATLLPTGAVVIGILALAAVGAMLGAFTGWAVVTGDEAEARVWPEVEEWLAA